MLRKKKPDYIPYKNPSFGEMWKWDFITLIPKSIRRKEIIKYTDLLDWEKIGETAIAEIKIVMKKMNIPEINPTLKFNKALVEGILSTDIKNRLHPNILHDLMTINKRDSKATKGLKTKNSMNKILFEIRRCKSIYEMLLQFGSFKWIKDAKTLKKKIDKLRLEYAKKIPKNPGKKYLKEKLKIYEDILKENDKAIDSGGDGNYAEATRIIVKKYRLNFKKIYRSFNRFKLSKGVLTHKDYEKFDLLYYSR